jgi:putative polyketide hydroxylase
LPLVLDGIFTWTEGAVVAERFADERTFLVGDSEHVMTPAGGFGMNLGIQNAHNLAWKLAAVLNGWAAATLLDTYEAERAPVVRNMVEEMTRRIRSTRTTGSLFSPTLFREHGLVFGATYASPAIEPDGALPVQVADPMTDYLPSACPGGRAPHVWLEQDGHRISTLDLFTSGFTLLAGPRGRTWCEAAESLASEVNVPMKAYIVGPLPGLIDSEGEWMDTYGVGPADAVLVRPDGYVAWRSASIVETPEAGLSRVLRKLLQHAQGGCGAS